MFGLHDLTSMRLTRKHLNDLVLDPVGCSEGTWRFVSKAADDSTS
jgi:hypothetical protein